MKKIILILGLLTFLITDSARAFLSQGYNVEQLAEKAHVIFMGEVTQVVISDNSQNYPYVQVYFRVYESMKGSVPSVYSFKQFAPKVGKQFSLMGMDRDTYVPGQKLVMFLGAPSPVTGLSAPENFETFVLQSKSDRPSDLDRAVILNNHTGEKITSRLTKNLQKTSSIRAAEKIKKGSNQSTLSFKDFRTLIQASVQ